MRKRVLAVILAAVMVVGGLSAMPHEAEAAVLWDDYKYRGTPAGAYYVDDWNFYKGECTSFLAWRLNNSNGIGFNNYYGGVKWGHAKNWGSAARSIGITVDSNPAVGSIAWSNSGDYGHVAWVAEVNGNNVTIEEYNNGYIIIGGEYHGNHKYNCRTVNKSVFSGYIHIKDLVSTPPDAPTVSFGQKYFMEDQNIYISWNAVSGATFYQYYLTEYPEGYAYTTNARSGSTSATSITFKGSELKNGRYSFFLHAVNSAGSSPQSNWVSFDIYAKDYVPVKTEVYNGHIYALYDNGDISWSFARDLCTNIGGHLVTVNSQAEQTFLEGLIQSGRKDAYWLGATNVEGVLNEENKPYKWVTGESFSYINWYSGEPNFSGEKGTREHFAEMRKSMGWKWNDVNNISKSSKGFILEIEPSENDIAAEGTFGGSDYYIIDRNTTWTEAKAYCEMMGGHLLTIESNEESSYIDTLIKQGTRAWYYCGAKQENGVWKWISGETVENLDKNPDWQAWNNPYLMKYKSNLKYAALGNAYYPEHDIKNIGFICEVPVVSEKYNITVNPGEGGTAAASLTQAEAGQEITITATPDSGYELEEISYTPAAESAINITNAKEFIMPSKDVTVNVIFKPISQDALVLRVGNVTAKTGGNEVRVPVEAVYNPGYVYGSVIIGWDNSIFKLKDVVYTGLAPDAGSPAISDDVNQAGKYQISFGDDAGWLENVTETGTFFTLVFEPVEGAKEGKYDITISRVYEFINVDLGEVDSELIGGSITLKNSSISGDVNSDGVLNATDKAILNRYLAGWEGYEERILDWDAADINRDTKVNSLDKAILNRYLAGWEGYDSYFAN